jgi:hypothetical protein
VSTMDRPVCRRTLIGAAGLAVLSGLAPKCDGSDLPVYRSFRDFHREYPEREWYYEVRARGEPGPTYGKGWQRVGYLRVRGWPRGVLWVKRYTPRFLPPPRDENGRG